jgi:diketogulonate reductase-like aldo/keto reductase
MDALKYLSDLRGKGMIKHLGLTNFDTEHMQIMVDSDIQIVSNQVQYSIIDRRPEVKMIPFCLKHNIVSLPMVVYVVDLCQRDTWEEYSRHLQLT